MVCSISRSMYVLGVLAALAAVSATAQDKLGVADPQAYLMDESEEIALSRSAAPASISAEANVLVLQADGSFRAAVQGTNGWTCFTGRSWSGPAQFEDGKRAWTANAFDTTIRAPQCFNKAATGSMLKMHRIATKHFMNGATTDEVDLAIGYALTTGEIEQPQVGAMSYMYSPDQVLTPDGGRFHPHVMIYQPHVTQEDFGRGSPMEGVPMVTEGGSVFATTVILSSHWSDGTPAHGM
ncbi:hypothetical protein [Altererythrobacter lutimaris]|uniref:Uncharacterized protein n=1 Tax=Altererythrobacter lutimaris TaxID=2743979 RepID=A0A850H7L6_9SPHN|nr:hypothetical protein [Altererythrobacter lutimaris]NVE93530.1 hypothetical protein [Altererythrobacter lutimaris]